MPAEAPGRFVWWQSVLWLRPFYWFSAGFH
ncbi:MAG: hypothetical protein KatS3mg111_2082 [Pirellulaceae bacterium]|nr:MAG: hypothetical protein KatS3mg111_2082 [Pirellulaceae bacterium]